MTLHELDSSSAVNTFKSSNANALVCFSATWCGPCKASKPQLESMASSYEQDPSTDVRFGIVYEHNLAEAIHDFGIKAFPTYVLYVNNGSEAGKIEGVNFDGIKSLIAANGCKMDLGEGHSLGGSAGDVKPLSATEARAQRLAMFEKKKPAQAEATTITGEAMDVTEENKDENTPMETEPTVDTEVKGTDTKTNEVEGKDVDMKDVSPNDQTESEVEMIHPAESLSKEHLDTLTGAMGFSLLRAQKGLLNGNGSVEGAIEWLMTHQDDEDIDEPIALVPKEGTVAKSYKCNECGKYFSNMANLELHANKTGHSDFEESTVLVKPLTAEEKAVKVEEIKALLKAKREEREEEEKVDHIEREKQRRSMGQQMTKTREEMDRQARMREAKQRKKQKDETKRERAHIKAEIEKDKLERKAHKGKLQSKLGIDGYHPDAIQYDVDDEGHKPDTPVKKKPKASVTKLDDYISKISAYRAGGDGGKCLKVLLAYIKNVVDKPDEDKFKHINSENKVYKAKVKPFLGAKALLLAVGFTPNDAGSGFDLDEHADRTVLAQTKEKLEQALASY